MLLKMTKTKLKLGQLLSKVIIRSCMLVRKYAFDHGNKEVISL